MRLKIENKSKNAYFYQNTLQIDENSLKRVKIGRFWVILGVFWPPKKDPQKGVKNDPFFGFLSENGGVQKRGSPIPEQIRVVNWLEKGSKIGKIPIFWGPGIGKTAKIPWNPFLGLFWGSQIPEQIRVVNRTPKKHPKNGFSPCRYFLGSDFKTIFRGGQK